MPSIKDFTRYIVHLVIRPDAAKRKFMAKYCSRIKGKRILEIGSGKPVNGKYIYSVKDKFHASNRFECTDIIPEFGHKILDITTMQLKNKYDIIVCFNVLEHVFDFNSAIRNMHAALRNKGQLLVLVPVFYPLHDEPHDYWRYTEHSLRKLFSGFRKITIDHSGLRQFPSFYFVKAEK